MPTTNIEALLDEMTLVEQVSLLTGADFWTTVPIPRLGVPAFKVTDGPNGARGGIFKDGPSTACFPVGIALRATWNPALINRSARRAALRPSGAKSPASYWLIRILKQPRAPRSLLSWSQLRRVMADVLFGSESRQSLRSKWKLG